MMTMMMTYDDDACDCGEEATQQQGKTFPVELPPSQVLIKGVITDHDDQSFDRGLRKIIENRQSF